MKKLLKIGILCMAVVLLATGCSEEKEPPAPAQTRYPVSVSGSEILLGETTVQSLLNAGLKITVSEMDAEKKITQYEIDPEAELEANSYYNGGSIWISESLAAHISMVTDEKAIRMGDAVIARLEFMLTSRDAEGMDKITFNGVPVAEINREKAGEMFPDFTGDDYMLLQYGSEYDYSLGFSQENGFLTDLSLSKKYDVDWNSES